MKFVLLLVNNVDPLIHILIYKKCTLHTMQLKYFLKKFTSLSSINVYRFMKRQYIVFSSFGKCNFRNFLKYHYKAIPIRNKISPSWVI